MEIVGHDVLRLRIYTTKIESINNDILLSEIQSTPNKIPDNLNYGFGELTNNTFFEDSTYPFGQNESEKLLKEIKRNVSIIASTDMKIDEAWTLTLGIGQSVMSHSHRSSIHIFPDEYYSVAYYVNAPEGSANLLFDIGYCNIGEAIYKVQPEEGLLVVFNSYMKHMTSRHNSLTPRVVVSANLSPVNPRLDKDPDLSGYSVM